MKAKANISPESVKKQNKPIHPAKSGRPPLVTHPAITKDGIGEVPRPAGTSRGAFGLVVTGDCLSPKVKNGQVVIVDKGLPKPGELAVVWATGLAMPQVKVLAAPIRGFPHHPESTVCHGIELEQLNPPRRFRIWADRIEKIMRVAAVVNYRCQESVRSDE